MAKFATKIYVKITPDMGNYPASGNTGGLFRIRI